MREKEYQKLILETNRKFQIQRSDICKQIQQELIQWHTPKHGIRSREELEDFPSYRELIESKKLMDHNLINPTEDIILEQGKIQVRNLWFYKKWGLVNYPPLRQCHEAGACKSQVD